MILLIKTLHQMLQHITLIKTLIVKSECNVMSLAGHVWHTLLFYMTK